MTHTSQPCPDCLNSPGFYIGLSTKEPCEKCRGTGQFPPPSDNIPTLPYGNESVKPRGVIERFHQHFQAINRLKRLEPTAKIEDMSIPYDPNVTFHITPTDYSGVKPAVVENKDDAIHFTPTADSGLKAVDINIKDDAIDADYPVTKEFFFKRSGPGVLSDELTIDMSKGRPGDDHLKELIEGVRNHPLIGLVQTTSAGITKPEDQIYWPHHPLTALNKPIEQDDPRIEGCIPIAPEHVDAILDLVMGGNTYFCAMTEPSSRKVHWMRMDQFTHCEFVQDQKALRTIFDRWTPGKGINECEAESLHDGEGNPIQYVIYYLRTGIEECQILIDREHQRITNWQLSHVDGCPIMVNIPAPGFAYLE